MNLSDFAGRYCERIGPGFWDEPFNAISNLAFIVAAFAIFRLWRREGSRDLPVLLLTAVAFAVGIGSFLFHTHTNHLTWLADVIPIAIFIGGYLLLALCRFHGFGLAAGIGLLVAFEALTIAVVRLVPPEFLNRATGYLLALAALIVVGTPLYLRSRSEKERAAGQALLFAALLFGISLFFRTIDHSVCAAVAYGTHFLWHIFNALVIYVLLRAALLHGPCTK